jgi:hypothetical protein
MKSSFGRTPWLGDVILPEGRRAPWLPPASQPGDLGSQRTRRPPRSKMHRAWGGPSLCEQAKGLLTQNLANIQRFLTAQFGRHHPM